MALTTTNTDQAIHKIEQERLTQVHPIATSTYLPETWSEIDQFMRCPIPPITSSPDTVNQFWRGNLPQYRIMPSQTLIDASNNNGGGSSLQGSAVYLQDSGGNWWKVTISSSGSVQTVGVSKPGA